MVGFKGFFRRRLPSQPETPSGPPDALPPKDEAQGETGTPQWAVEQLREIDPSNVTIYGKIADIIATLERALAAAEGEKRSMAIDCQCMMGERDNALIERDAALAELQTLKAGPLPVPQTPQEHIEDVMESSFNRGCG